jgi:hypothetical protein
VERQVKILAFSHLLLFLAIACQQQGGEGEQFSDRDEEQRRIAQVQGRDADVKRRETDTQPTETVQSESILPPANISGSYLIDCALTDTLQSSKNPAQVKFGCMIVNQEGDAVTSEGQWTAALLNPLTGDALQTLDVKLGTFQLSSTSPQQLASAMNRVMITFHGTVDGKSGVLTEKGQRTLSPDLVKEQAIVRYGFTVQIVSGTRTGRTHTGAFQYDSSLLTGTGQETLTAQSLQFDYLPANQQAFDAAGLLSFMDGRLVSLTVLGGPGTQRFGINAGFDRNQFGRVEEDFVRNGEQFFGYLSTDGFVDGAGTIRYTLR